MIFLRKARADGSFLSGRSRRWNFWSGVQLCKLLCWVTWYKSPGRWHTSAMEVTYQKKNDLLGKWDPHCEFCLELHVLPLQRVNKSWNKLSNIIKMVCVTPGNCFVCSVRCKYITKIGKNTIAIYLHRIYVEPIEEHCIGVAVWWASFGIKTCDVISHAGSVLATTHWLIQPAWSFEHLSAL